MKRVFWKELQLLGARVYDRTDFTAAVELLVQGAIPVDALVSTTAALAQAPAAFESLAQGGRVMKVLVDCRAGAS
jgi:threonine dehydrogenase-like Zn-dependent dehydrogenase